MSLVALALHFPIPFLLAVGLHVRCVYAAAQGTAGDTCEPHADLCPARP